MAEFSSEYLQSLKQSLFPLILDTDPGMELVSPSAMIDHSTFNDNPIGYNALFSHPAPEFPGNLAETVPALFSHHTNHLHEHASGSLVQPGMMMSGGDGDGESHHNKKRKPSDVSQSSSANSSAPPAFDNGRKQKHSRAKKIKGNVEKESEEGAKEVVHVRARRGQATDSHSLAERVRRGKINERLKCLQDIVPGCYKTMGLAVMLDEIINYVQSLQHQVEFLSMKLTAASTFYDFNSESDAIEKMQRAKVFEAKELERLIREGQGQGGHQHQQHPLLRPTWHS